VVIDSQQVSFMLNPVPAVFSALFRNGLIKQWPHQSGHQCNLIAAVHGSCWLSAQHLFGSLRG
jgi:hypothetical protein